jgi:hypothetical protein
MATQYLTGNDGGITFPAAHGGHLATWNASFSRQVSDITGYGDSGRRRLLGIWDVTGSAGGILTSDSPGADAIAADGAALTLKVSTACTYGMTAVISDIAMSVTKTGDAAVTFNFSISNGTIPTETWDETP